MLKDAAGLTQVRQQIAATLPETVDPRQVLRFWIRYEYAKRGTPFAATGVQMPAASPATPMQIIP
ncbi:hypothetical protein HJG54_00925 [Leptolyngbya sp. NK1-12]|uniref:Uncharacterized protein n=1 Tax=Leptolyngbya sp. NK1-12 TaxID=2547451 RepID=A0AA97AG96_9CYAN|nr:hypothetical protein [Leptolyngbya sp. NK1-12]WNZ21571.1 hypothetical protein HJG54_00925 [Leptolyngbya sp. NK1-12]